MSSYDHYTMLRLGLGRWSDHQGDPPRHRLRARLTPPLYGRFRRWLRGLIRTGRNAAD